MKYELLRYELGKETETDSDGNYSVNIIIGIKPTDEIAPPFNKEITVISNNDMTGYQVDTQRLDVVNNYINLINGI